MSTPAHIMVLDPSVKSPELESFNHLAEISPLPLTYHLPAMFGLGSVERDREGVAGILLLGSASSVHDRRDWQVALENWLRPRLENKVPTLGICYGHQMIAYMLGGEVSYHTPEQKKLLGLRKVSLAANPLWGKAREGELRVSHNEIVSRAPAEMQIAGRSDLVAIEALAHTRLPIWSFQSHPEAAPGSSQYYPGPEECDRFGDELLLHFIRFAQKGIS